MNPKKLLSLPAATLLTLALAPAGDAGQKRVDVGNGGSFFALRDAPINLGDHVAWVLVNGGHTVTSGLGNSDPEVGLLFDASLGIGSGAAFSWRCNLLTRVRYFCRPHVNDGMFGSLLVSASGVNVSSFRISEVQYNEASGLDRIEIVNLGGGSGDLGKYRVAISGTTAATVPLVSVVVLQGASPGRVVIHTNENLASTQTDLYMPGIGDLPATGSVALYMPNTVAGHTSLTNATQVIDFVQWGAGSQVNSATAVQAGVWPSVGDFVPAVPAAGGYDLAFCGTESQRGPGFWQVALPNFRSQAICATPARTSSWGRVKLLYR